MNSGGTQASGRIDKLVGQGYEPGRTASIEEQRAAIAIEHGNRDDNGGDILQAQAAPHRRARNGAAVRTEVNSPGVRIEPAGTCPRVGTVATRIIAVIVGGRRKSVGTHRGDVVAAGQRLTRDVVGVLFHRVIGVAAVLQEEAVLKAEDEVADHVVADVAPGRVGWRYSDRARPMAIQRTVRVEVGHCTGGRRGGRRWRAPGRTASSRPCCIGTAVRQPIQRAPEPLEDDRAGARRHVWVGRHQVPGERDRVLSTGTVVRRIAHGLAVEEHLIIAIATADRLFIENHVDIVPVHQVAKIVAHPGERRAALRRRHRAAGASWRWRSGRL